MAKAKSLVASAISPGRLTILFLRCSAEANTPAIESEVFLLGISHRTYCGFVDIDERLPCPQPCNQIVRVTVLQCPKMGVVLQFSITC